VTAPKVALKPDVYRVVARAVEEGVAYGYERAHKYDDKPSEETIQDQIEQAVMAALSEVVKW
jgi:hypothetical protein